MPNSLASTWPFQFWSSPSAWSYFIPSQHCFWELSLNHLNINLSSKSFLWDAWAKTRSQNLLHSFIYFVALGFELRVSHLLGRYSAAWVTASSTIFYTSLSLYICSFLFFFFSFLKPIFLIDWSCFQLCSVCSSIHY
jgi:hypothetical protein